jgi:hypothetical protein
MTVAFDTYEFINELKQSGLSEVQAKVISDGIKKSIHECKFGFKEELKSFTEKDQLKNYVTKDDLKNELRMFKQGLLDEIKVIDNEIKRIGNLISVRVAGLMVLILTIFELLQHFRLN